MPYTGFNTLGKSPSCLETLLQHFVLKTKSSVNNILTVFLANLAYSFVKKIHNMNIAKKELDQGPEWSLCYFLKYLLHVFCPWKHLCRVCILWNFVVFSFSMPFQINKNKCNCGIIFHKNLRKY